MVIVQEVLSYLGQLAPFSSQESYDNSGLQVGSPMSEVKGILVCLDCTEDVVEEAVAKGCNLIVSHHPLIFKGVKSLSGKTYVERTLIACIQNNLNLIAVHTNLDNSISGVNAEISKRIGLVNTRILQPKENVIFKLEVFVPKQHLNQLKSALFLAGVGTIGNYEECGFFAEGTGTFKPKIGATPTIGEINQLSHVEEVKAEFIFSKHLQSQVLSAMFANHPYEEVAYNIIPLVNHNQTEGAGMIGELTVPMDEEIFLQRIKEIFGCQLVRHTRLLGKKIKTVAVCGGSGSFLINLAKQNRADIFITADFKYHEFFDSEGQIVIADIGHYESEQFTSHLIIELLKKKFTNFAVHLTGINTNPINYF
jgi:dinuclear metal center YbgI/SA1388 family protein